MENELSDNWDPEQITLAQYKSVLKALEDLEMNEQAFVIDSNGARRSVTKVDYQWLMRRESRLLERLNSYSGRSSVNLYAKD